MSRTNTHKIVGAHIPLWIAQALKEEAEKTERSTSWLVGKILKAHVEASCGEKPRSKTDRKLKK